MTDPQNNDKQEPVKPRSRGIYLLPNLFTTGALFSGFYAVVASMNGHFENAAVAIFVAMVLDGLDGRVARMTNTSSAFGAEYDSLVDMVTNYPETYNLTQPLDGILESMYHWRLGHISDGDMLQIIISALDYQYGEEEVEIYGVSHSSRLYIIDQDSNIRVLWRGTEWTYASIYHDIQLLL